MERVNRHAKRDRATKAIPVVKMVCAQLKAHVPTMKNVQALKSVKAAAAWKA